MAKPPAGLLSSIEARVAWQVADAVDSALQSIWRMFSIEELRQLERALRERDYCNEQAARLADALSDLARWRPSG